MAVDDVVKSIDAVAWLDEHGTIAGLPMPCTDNPGAEHPLVEHDHEVFNETQRRLPPIAADEPPDRVHAVRMSPDLAHMLLGSECSHVSAGALGYKVTCDPSLPPGTIA